MPHGGCRFVSPPMSRMTRDCVSLAVLLRSSMLMRKFFSPRSRFGIYWVGSMRTFVRVAVRALVLGRAAARGRLLRGHCVLMGSTVFVVPHACACGGYRSGEQTMWSCGAAASLSGDGDWLSLLGPWCCWSDVVRAGVGCVSAIEPSLEFMVCPCSSAAAVCQLALVSVHGHGLPARWVFLMWGSLPFTSFSACFIGLTGGLVFSELGWLSILSPAQCVTARPTHADGRRVPWCSARTCAGVSPGYVVPTWCTVDMVQLVPPLMASVSAGPFTGLILPVCWSD